MLQEDTGSWLLGMQQAQDKVQHGCASGGRKEQREERRRVGGAATTDNANRQRGGDGVAEEVGGGIGEGAEALAATESCYQKMDKREREYKRMDKQGWVEKADEEEEDEEEEEEKAEGVDRAGTEMGMEIAEKGMEKGTDEEMGEAVEGMEVEE